jgi:hypothetical protein
MMFYWMTWTGWTDGHHVGHHARAIIMLLIKPNPTLLIFPFGTSEGPMLGIPHGGMDSVSGQI